MHRRSLLAAAVAAALPPSILGRLAAAQEATPAAGPFAGLGLPELRITVTADGFEGVPDETPAGRYLLTAGGGGGPDGTAVAFLQLPEALDLAGFREAVAGSAATAPEWFYRTGLAGGAAAPGQAVIDLTPGNWIVWGDDPAAPQPPVALRVTDAAATPAAASEPTADATVTLYEYGFKVEGAFTPGPRVVEVVNAGRQPHFVIGLRSPAPITKDQVMRLLEMEGDATPAPDEDLPNPDEILPAFYAPTLSLGAREWVAADLAPGWYILLCFVPDEQTGAPHAFMGMYDVVQVGGEATPAA